MLLYSAIFVLFMQGGDVVEEFNGSEGGPDEPQYQKIPDDSGRGLQDTARPSLFVSAFSNSVVFWLQTFFAPGLQVRPCACTCFLFNK